MTLSPEIKKDPEYRKVWAWIAAAFTFLILEFILRADSFIPVGTFGFLICFFVGTKKYLRIRKKYLQPKATL